MQAIASIEEKFCTEVKISNLYENIKSTICNSLLLISGLLSFKNYNNLIHQVL